MSEETVNVLVENDEDIATERTVFFLSVGFRVDVLQSAAELRKTVTETIGV